MLQSQEFYAGEHHVFDLAVFERVVDDLAVASLGDDLRRAQQSELVGTRRLVEPQHAREVAYAHLGDGEGADDLGARRVRTRPEKLREHMQGGVARHIFSDEFGRAGVKQGFHSRIIIPSAARKLASFGEEYLFEGIFDLKVCEASVEVAVGKLVERDAVKIRKPYAVRKVRDAGARLPARQVLLRDPRFAGELLLREPPCEPQRFEAFRDVNAVSHTLLLHDCV